MEPCLEYLELMNAVLDGEATLEQEEALAAHLSACPACAALYHDLTALRQGADALVVSPPADFSASVLAAIKRPAAPASKSSPARRWRPVAAMAAVCALALLGSGSLKYLSRFGAAPEGAAFHSPVPSPTLADVNSAAGAGAMDAPAQAPQTTSLPVQDGGAPSDGSKPRSSAKSFTEEYGGYTDSAVNPEYALQSEPSLPAAETAPRMQSYAAASAVPVTGESADNTSGPAPAAVRSVLPSPAAAAPPEELFPDSSAPSLGGLESAPEPAPDAAAVDGTAQAPQPPAPEPSPNQLLLCSLPPVDGGAQSPAPAPTPVPVTPGQAMELVVEYICGGTGCPMELNCTEDGEILSCTLSLSGGADTADQSTVTYTGLSPNGQFYTFDWTWADQAPEEAELFRYAVHLDGAYVMWLGEAADGGERFRAALGEQ